MAENIHVEESLVQKLPLPLAKLYVRASNSKNPLDRHQTAYCVWEATLRLLASAAVATYAERPEPDPDLEEALRKLARPSPGGLVGARSAGWSRSWRIPAMRVMPRSERLVWAGPGTTCRGSPSSTWCSRRAWASRTGSGAASAQRAVRPPGAVSQPRAGPRGGQSTGRRRSSSGWPTSCWPASPSCWGTSTSWPAGGWSSSKRCGSRNRAIT